MEGISGLELVSVFSSLYLLQRLFTAPAEAHGSGDVWPVRLRLSGVAMADCVSPSLLQLVGLLPLLHLGVLGAERDLPVYQGAAPACTGRRTLASGRGNPVERP